MRVYALHSVETSSPPDWQQGDRLSQCRRTLGGLAEFVVVILTMAAAISLFP